MNNLTKANYFNDYFNMLDNNLLKDGAFMKSDIYEKNNTYVIDIDLPGVKKQDIIINYENGYLIISASKKQEVKDIKNYIRQERFFGEVKRSFYIGKKKETDINATFIDGNLTISFPKENEPKKDSKTIIIK